MKHGPDTEQRLLRYTEGELPEADREAVAKHLETCEACRKTMNEHVESLEQLLQGIARPPEVEPVRANEVARQVRLRRRRRVVRVRTVLAAACLALMVGLVQVRPAVAPPTTTPAHGDPAISPQEIAHLKLRIAVMEEQLAALEATIKDRAARRARLTSAQHEEVAAISVTAGESYEASGSLPEAVVRYRYAAESFPDTTAAIKARARLAKLNVNII